MGASETGLVVLGRISGLFGTRGWVKVFSETEPRENILTYRPWYLDNLDQPVELVEGARHGKAIIARLQGFGDREQAASLIGRAIAVRREQLPPPARDELYWVDLEGLAVSTVSGISLGRIERLFSTGANDVLVVWGERERLIPFLWETVVKDVDLATGSMIVDWDPDF